MDILLRAPLDGQRTRLELDGAAIPFAIVGNRVQASLSGLAEGAHHLHLVAVDGNGKSGDFTRDFGSDTVAPAFTWSVRNATASGGWGQSPMRVEGSVTPDAGSPAKLQFALGVQGSSGWVDGAWKDLGSGGSSLPQGTLYRVRVRALDDAGNVAVADPSTLGWQPSFAPLTFKVPSWTRNATLDIGMDSTGKGPPQHVQAELRPWDPTAPAMRVNATGQEGKLSFPGLAPGRYSLSLLDLVDDAGNRPTALPGPWTIGVDRQPPTLSVRQDAAGLHAFVKDGVSGVGEVTAAERKTDGHGAGNVSLDLGQLAKPVVLVASDEAGNVAQWQIDPEGVAKPTVQVQQATSTSSGKGSPSVGAGLGILVLALALVAGRRNRGGSSVHAKVMMEAKGTRRKNP
jgi:hypothetical protein